VVVALLIGFAALVVVMLIAARGNDVVWQRRVYLFGAAEAIVFTAVGWLFGREVHRAEAESARKDATDAKQDAASARDEAKNLAKDAATAEQRAVEEHTKGKAVQAAVKSIPTGRPRDTGGPSDAGYDEGPPPGNDAVIGLKALVDELYGPAPTP